MSSPEIHGSDAADERNLTIIVVPHGDLETRSFEIPYRKLKVALLVGIALLLLFGFLIAMFLLYAHIASLDFVGISQRAGDLAPGIVTAICLFLFLGCAGAASPPQATSA